MGRDVGVAATGSVTALRWCDTFNRLTFTRDRNRSNSGWKVSIPESWLKRRVDCNFAFVVDSLSYACPLCLFFLGFHSCIGKEERKR